MANGNLVQVLIHTDVTKYLYFKAVDGSYVFNKGKVLFVLVLLVYLNGRFLLFKSLGAGTSRCWARDQ